MAGELQRRCLICARIFEVKGLTGIAQEEEFPGEAPKTKSICPLCEAKIKKEAGDAQQEPKPM